MPKKVTSSSNRLETLDYLRGFFIVVIVIDHFSRWPSLLGIFSGKALLWVTAAEGFVAISGLLVGYVRGYKNKDRPMKEVTGKLLRRALLLYFWSILGSVIYTAIIWYVPFQGGAPGIPIAKGDWQELLYQLITLDYTYVWVHFLTLYALFLAASPIAIWLLRHNRAWAVILLSLVAYVIGRLTHIESLQWQLIFFIPTVVGYNLPNIMTWWKKQAAKKRQLITFTTIGLTTVTVALSVVCTFYATGIQPFADWLNTFFAKDTISLWRAAIAFLWFGGFFFLFNLGRRFIKRFFGWLLLPFGTRSLTAYILHGVALCILSYFTLGGSNFAENTVLGIVAIMIVWGLLKIPYINKIVPS